MLYHNRKYTSCSEQITYLYNNYLGTLSQYYKHWALDSTSLQPQSYQEGSPFKVANLSTKHKMSSVNTKPIHTKKVHLLPGTLD